MSTGNGFYLIDGCILNVMLYCKLLELSVVMSDSFQEARVQGARLGTRITSRSTFL
jgi:hypothetical protein